MMILVVGLGAIGGRIARSLDQHGHKLFVHDKDGAHVAAVSRDLGAGSMGDGLDPASLDAVVVAVPGPDQSRDVAVGEEFGLLRRLTPGSTYVDCTTSSPDAVATIAGVAADHGVHFVDAPLSGLPPAATAMVGAQATSFAGADEVLSCFCSSVEVVGGTGAGTVVKLMNQYLAFGNFVAACEAFELARAHGIDPARALAAIRHSFGASEALDSFGRHVLGGDLDGTSGSLGIVRKDVAIVAEAFDRLGLRPPMAGRLTDLFTAAGDRGWDERGFAAVSELVGQELHGRTGGARRG